MSFLEADISSVRKSRRNSMLILRAASQLNLAEGNTDNQNLELLNNAEIEPTIKPEGEFSKTSEASKSHGHVNTNSSEAMVIWLSALYGKLLIVIGMGFPIGRFLSHDLHLFYYNSFYLYLYFGSILFVAYAYMSLLSSFTMRLERFSIYFREFLQYLRPFLVSYRQRLGNFCVEFQRIQVSPVNEVDTEESQVDGSSDSCMSDYSSETSSLTSTPIESEKEDYTGPRSKFVYTEKAGHGSMYLKMGTIIFGIGSMIYSGLEFGQYFELSKHCADILMAVTPASRMVFTFVQMYFVFMNSRISISRHTTIARFGFMHMVATNLCIWLNILVEETKHTIHHITHLQHEEHHGDDHHYEGVSHTSVPSEVSLFSNYSKYLLNDSIPSSINAIIPSSEEIKSYPYALDLTEDLFSDGHSISKRASDDLSDCRVLNLMGNMVNTAAPLLFPCTIEYSLLCASVIYIMWKNVLTNSQKNSSAQENAINLLIAKKVRHLYSVDCGRASRGLFTGIFVLVLTLISLILFYVLISHPEFKIYGIIAAFSSEILIYSLGIVTTIIGMKQIRRLGFHDEEETDLDNVLLVVAQGGVYMFTIFTLIGGYFSEQSTSWMVLFTAMLTLIQATLQTIYILDGSSRRSVTPEQLERKHGREMVTFMLVLNLAMWLFSTFQTSRTYLHSAQQEFYGIWAWTIITHVSMPLGIFYRFHATVCLGEIWKRAYKMTAEE